MAIKGAPRKPRWDAGMTQRERREFKMNRAATTVVGGGCRGIDGSGSRCGKQTTGNVPYCQDHK